MLAKNKISIYIINFRRYATNVQKTENFSLASRPDPNLILHDYIGPPDKKSNLRPIVRHIPQNETPLQQRLRLNRIAVENWNNDFWTNHNKRFFEERDEFIKIHKTHDADTVSADKMSVFYKDFLDRNWRIHLLYNVSWYIKNLSLLVLAAQVAVGSIFKSKGKIP